MAPLRPLIIDATAKAKAARVLAHAEKNHYRPGPDTARRRRTLRGLSKVRSPRLNAASSRKAALNQNSIPLSKTVNTP
jgi:hypothetical protein